MAAPPPPAESPEEARQKLVESLNAGLNAFMFSGFHVKAFKNRVR